MPALSDLLNLFVAMAILMLAAFFVTLIGYWFEMPRLWIMVGVLVLLLTMFAIVMANYPAIMN